jgi:hypothetical protein
MSSFWATIIKSRYDAHEKTREDVLAYVPKMITQEEADSIIAGSP